MNVAYTKSKTDNKIPAPTIIKSKLGLSSSLSNNLATTNSIIKEIIKRNCSPFVILPLMIDPINNIVAEVTCPLGKEYQVDDSKAFS